MNTSFHKRSSLLACMLLTLCSQALFSQTFKVTTTQVSGNIYMLEGRGGNIGLCIGDDGVFMIDDQFARYAKPIAAAIAKLSDKPIKFLLNTHWHGDHVGGNLSFAKKGAIIVAHENVRRRMSTKQFIKFANRAVPPAPIKALPIVTFGDKVTFHWNGETIKAIHCQHGHTDGDVVVHFAEANAFHMGDLFFNGRYPIVDISSGGHIDGLIEAGQRVLKMSNDKTKIIPGHGKLSHPVELKKWLDMLIEVRARVAKMLKSGMTIAQVVAKKPTGDFDKTYGTKGGLMPADKFVAIIATCLSTPNKQAAKKTAPKK